MRRIICDVCGLDVNKNDLDSILMNKPNKEVGLFGAISCTCGDVCGNCVRRGRTLDFKSLMINKWKEEILNA